MGMVSVALATRSAIPGDGNGDRLSPCLRLTVGGSASNDGNDHDLYPSACCLEVLYCDFLAPSSLLTVTD